MNTATVEVLNAAEADIDKIWITVCGENELLPNIGVRALVEGHQVALFRVRNQFYAVSAIDPFSKAAVLSRGLVGDLGGRVVVASPLYKQHFDLSSGQCLEDPSVRLEVFAARCTDGKVQVALR